MIQLVENFVVLIRKALKVYSYAILPFDYLTASKFQWIFNWFYSIKVDSKRVDSIKVDSIKVDSIKVNSIKVAVDIQLDLQHQS